MSKALVNALAIALLEEGFVGGDGISFVDGKAFAEQFFAENAELLAAPVVRPPTPQRPATAGDLSADQQAALAVGVPLCPNCQQPVNDHLPACSRATGYDGKATTKNKLEPVA